MDVSSNACSLKRPSSGSFLARSAFNARNASVAGSSRGRAGAGVCVRFGAATGFGFARHFRATITAITADTNAATHIHGTVSHHGAATGPCSGRKPFALSDAVTVGRIVMRTVGMRVVTGRMLL